MTIMARPMTETPEPRLGGRVVPVPVDGGACIVEIAGSGPPIIFLHGWTLDRRMWCDQFSALADRYTLIAIDRRGFGQSSAPPDRAAELADLEAVVAALGLARFALVGMSQAGSTAIGYALAHPAQVRALVLQGISLAGVPDRAHGMDAIPVRHFATLVEQGRLAEMKREWRDHPLMRTFSEHSATLAEAILDDYEGRDLLAGPSGPSASLADVTRIVVPTLAITGAADTGWRREIVRAIAKAAPRGQAHMIDGAGHLANMCRPDPFNAALTGFLEAYRVFGPVAANNP